MTKAQQKAVSHEDAQQTLSCNTFAAREIACCPKLYTKLNKRGLRLHRVLFFRFGDLWFDIIISNFLKRHGKWLTDQRRDGGGRYGTWFFGVGDPFFVEPM